MKIHPQLYSAPMIRALLAGRKTMTRRILTPQYLRVWTGGLDFLGRYVKPDAALFDAAMNNARDFRLVEGRLAWITDPAPIHAGSGAVMAQWLGKLSYQVGDLIYARERIEASGAYVQYEADGTVSSFPWPKQWKRSYAVGMHMPRAFSRLTLTVTGVKVERVVDISEEDAIAEGVELTDVVRGHRVWHASHRAAFADLWNILHTEVGERWEDNPYVIVPMYEVERVNVDALVAAA